MYHRYICLLCLLLAFFLGCTSKRSTEDSGSVQLSRMGIALKIPENFKRLSRERLEDLQTLGATAVEIEPFTVVPQYAYADDDGKGIMVISELQFN